MNRALVFLVVVCGCSPGRESEQVLTADATKAEVAATDPTDAANGQWRVDSIDDGVRLVYGECDPIGWWACAKEGEQALLSTSRGVVRRGDTLVFAIPKRSPTLLVDEADEHGVGHHYVYVGKSSSLRAHLASLHLYEGRGFVLVSQETGRVIPLDAIPVIAPGKGRFVTTSSDTDAGYSANRLQIYRPDADSVVLEWEIEPQLWGPEEPKWLGDSTILLKRRPGALHPDTILEHLTLRLTDRGWVADSTS